ncbi:MAG: S8 family serine peptidase [Prochloraceae cyanobacterium]
MKKNKLFAANKANFIASQFLLDRVGHELAWMYRNKITNLNNLEIKPTFMKPSLLQIREGKILISATGKNSDRLLKDLQAIGLEKGVSFDYQVSGWIPIDKIRKIANLPSLMFVRPVYRPITNVGSTTSQGDAALRADTARNNFNLDGSGITVGVLSDSYNFLNGASADIASGDLPANGVNVLQDSGFTDEGRAMLQIIHDVAPGANLAFNTADGGKAAFASGILNLADPNLGNADVIVDDVRYLDEPFFQDGIVARAVDTVVADGVAYFSSAGNSHNLSYANAFNPSGIFQTINGKTRQLHDFDSGVGVDTFQSITVANGASVTISFQWDEVFRSLDPNGTGSTNDLDIFIVEGTNFNNILASSIDNNIGQNPVEILQFTNDGSFSSNSFNIVIGKTAPGPNPGILQYVTFTSGSNDFSFNEFNTNSPTSFGHPNAAGASSVGAAFYFETPEFGTSPPLLEPFSSAGGIDILFDINNNRLSTPQSRQNVDIVAPDGGNTTFFGQDIGGSGEPDTFPNFFGTSAAAPHAAGVAALILQQAGGKNSLAPSALYSILESTAIDMDNPITPGFDTGFDRATGFGLIQADLAIAAVVNNAPPPLSLVVNTLIDENDGIASGGISLREALASIADGGTITIDSSINSGTIDLANGELEIDRNVAIDNSGANLTINAGGNNRVFKIDDANAVRKIDVSFDGLTITNGVAVGGSGGGIFSQENLTIFHSTISGNSTGYDGGGIYSFGDLTIINSTISNNSAGQDGGGIAVKNNANITDSTISGNFAVRSGAGIYGLDSTSVNNAVDPGFLNLGAIV